MARPWFHKRGLIGLAVLTIVGCGGASDDDAFPPLHPQYGSDILDPGRFQQTYTMSGGESFELLCVGYIDLHEQAGPSWTAAVHRRSNSRPACRTSGTIAGVVERDGSLTFTLTQERWNGSCTALGPGEYEGYLERNRFYAEGTTRLVCDDGREGTVHEIMAATNPAPPGSHDT